ncbi:MAG: hypothetical protein KAW52_08880 [candidate division Zixibacteria bacterium]|nr:hypothetical protein [candidate division Zixibacteria bacterium]
MKNEEEKSSLSILQPLKNFKDKIFSKKRNYAPPEKGFTQIPNKIGSHPDLTAQERSIIWVYYQDAMSKTTTCISVADTAKAAKVSRSTVETALKKFKKLKILDIVKHKKFHRKILKIRCPSRENFHK